jgi:hypothetical protein
MHRGFDKIFPDPPFREQEDINAGPHVLTDVDLCPNQIYHLISDENVVTMDTMFE